MSKELTPLEAAKRLLDKICSQCNSDICAVKNNGACKYFQYYKMIEKELKEYAGFQIVFKLSNRNEGKEIHDKLKALEIIKKKILDMDYFNVIADRCDLTYQEYDLLRKVLK